MGRSRTTMYLGTNSHFGSENVDIKAVLKDMAMEDGYKNWEIPFPDPMGFAQEQSKRRIESFVPEDTSWLVKTSWCLIYWGFWMDAYPNAKWVFPTRDTLKIVDSMNRHPGMRNHPDGQKHNYIANLLRCASSVMDHGAKYTFVDMEGLADREPDVIEPLFEFLEITPDYDVINDWIKPDILKR